VLEVEVLRDFFHDAEAEHVVFNGTRAVDFPMKVGI